MMKIGLYIITGASGAGKTILVPLLKEKLPKDFQVYDFDEILRPFDGTNQWSLEVVDKMMQITKDNKEKGISTVVAGLIRPYQVERIAPKYSIEDIKLLLLDVSTEERARRLHERGATMELIGDVEEHEGFRTWIKESKYPSEVIETTSKKPEEILEEVITWIES